MKRKRKTIIVLACVSILFLTAGAALANDWQTISTHIYYDHYNGNVGVGTSWPDAKFNVQDGSDVDLFDDDKPGYIVIGDTSGGNIGIDNNEIMARNNWSASPLFYISNGRVGIHILAREMLASGWAILHGQI